MEIQIKTCTKVRSAYPDFELSPKTDSSQPRCSTPKKNIKDLLQLAKTEPITEKDEKEETKFLNALQNPNNDEQNLIKTPMNTPSKHVLCECGATVCKLKKHTALTTDTEEFRKELTTELDYAKSGVEFKERRQQESEKRMARDEEQKTKRKLYAKAKKEATNINQLKTLDRKTYSGLFEPLIT